MEESVQSNENKSLASSTETKRPISAPYVQTDTIDPIEHPLDGKVYDSKSAIRRVTKAHGCEEIGNEKLSKIPQQLREAVTSERIHEALYEAEEILRQPDRRREVMGRWRHDLERAVEDGRLPRDSVFPGTE